MIKDLGAALRGIAVYKNITTHPLMESFSGLLDALSRGEGERALAEYTDFYYGLCRAGFAGPGDWLWDALRYEDAPFPLAVESGRVDGGLLAAGEHDLETLIRLATLDCKEILPALSALLPAEYGPVLEKLPRWRAGAPFTVEDLMNAYRNNGAGLFARYQAFLWEHETLLPVPDPDCMGAEALRGYEWQREEVLANTRALLEGRQVNNVLLYGDSGTGKSVTVKSLLAVPEFHNLRLIEVEKESLGDLPRLIRMLAGRRQKFILFIDDLAFDQDDRTYSALKTILEGGLEKRPTNVAVYATSNRRNLVRQTFSDRAGDEVDMIETIQEKTSLAERFGLRIPYLTMSRPEFLNMVEELAAVRGVSMERDKLRAEAVKWEMHHPGRTPRTARQFILSLEV